MEKKKAITYLPGTYGRNLAFLEALDYYNSIIQTREDSVRNNIVFEAYKNGDEEMANKALPVPLHEMATYDRDNEWEKLSLTEKQARIKKGAVPTQRRYQTEVAHLTMWQGDLGTVFMFDMIGVYRNLPYAGKVHYDVTTKKSIVGEYTNYTMNNLCPKIFVYQVLRQNFVPTRKYVYELISRSLEIPIVYITALHFARGIKEEDYPKILVRAASSGHSGTCLHMLHCGTLPNYAERTEIATICVRIVCDGTIEDDEERSTMSPFRRVRATLSDALATLGDKDEAHRIRTFRVMTEEEVAAAAERQAEKEREKQLKATAEDDLLDIDDFEEP